MDTQGDLLAAAEALSVWVHAQRGTSRGRRQTASAASNGSVQPHREPSAWVAAAAPIVFAPMPETPVAASPEPQIEVVELPPPPAPERDRTVLERAPRQPLMPRVKSALSATLRVAAVLVLVAAIGGAFVLAKARWATVQLSSGHGVAVIETVPPGAQVLVDGRPVGTTPVRVELDSGKHDLELSLKDLKKTQSISIDDDKETAVKISLATRRVGTLQVSSMPTGAKVSVDGRERGVTPVTIGDLAVGTHTLAIESIAGSVRRQVSVSEGRTESVAESIFPGWLHVSAPMEVVVTERGAPLQLDSRSRVLLKPGIHELQITNQPLGFSQSERVEIEPGATANIAIETPFASVNVNAPAGAAVFIDGVKAGEAPLSGYQVKIGTRDFTVVDHSGASRHVTATVRPGTTDVNVDF
jgi:hypothetical protein